MARGAKYQYRRQIKLHGESVKLRRYTGTGPTRTLTDYAVRATVKGYAPHELIGGIVQGDRRAIVLAEDVVAISFPLPITTTDKLVVRSKELAIGAVDDSTHRDETLLIAYEMKVTG